MCIRDRLYDYVFLNCLGMIIVILLYLLLWICHRILQWLGIVEFIGGLSFQYDACKLLHLLLYYYLLLIFECFMIIIGYYVG